MRVLCGELCCVVLCYVVKKPNDIIHTPIGYSRGFVTIKLDILYDVVEYWFGYYNLVGSKVETEDFPTEHSCTQLPICFFLFIGWEHSLGSIVYCYFSITVQ
mmetsp:Transcript_21577/g.59981  ORF Transcript_21577/g.59981 Transcript_21577/m.59981 type:complete len:102 (+) Transcript_21577:228-533(+)